MNEAQLALLFKYIDITITAAIQHEIGGETKDLLTAQDSFRRQLIASVGISQSSLLNEQHKIEQAETVRQTEGLKLLGSLI